jgi:hypothetical protein
MMTIVDEWESRSIERNNLDYKLNDIRLCETILGDIRDSYYEFRLLNGKEEVIGKCDVQDKELLDNHRWHVNSNLVKSTFNGKPVVFARMVMNVENCAVKYVDDNDHLNLRRSNLWVQKKSKLITNKPKKIDKSEIENLEKEEWRSLTDLGHPNYSVSDQGNVKNTVRGYNLKQCSDERGYYRVCLCTNNIKKQIFVHQLIGNTFLKDSKGDKKSIDHIDRNPKNNVLTNLRWATPKEQAQNLSRTGNGNSRPVNQYDKHGNLLRTWSSVAEAETETGIFSTVISQACLGKQKNAGGFIWKYIDMIDQDLSDEIWKTICYENCKCVTVSNKGRIIMKGNRKSIGKPDGNYLVVNIKSQETGKYRSIRMHRLIMAAFYGENPAMVVNHLNGVKSDNRLENLEYLTQRGNVLHAIETGLTPKGQRSGRKVLLTKSNGEITEYESMVACGKAMGITRTVVAKMCKNGSLHSDGFTCRRI